MAMARAPPFGVFILALCLVACVCAHGEDPKMLRRQLLRQHKHPQRSVLDKATDENTKAGKLLKDIETYKKDADAAVTEAEKAPKDNKEAEAIAKKAKKYRRSLLSCVMMLYRGTEHR
ncbi:hypothetical protein [Streptomyces hygroscopicus]|uniref:hypothetical protein n=1 Tax=Streptomyces hygroscopicus TaxID=1912 RepID=UPI003F19C196